MGYRVAVVGATGNVGREMLNILEEVDFPVDKIHALASRKSIGVKVSFGDREVACQDIEQFDFSSVDIVLMSVSGSFSKEWSPKIGAAGPIVIDNSSAFRMDPDVPLIVPEVNPDDVSFARRKNIIANPNCSTAQLVVALKPLHDRARIKRVVVSTYQSVSGAGKEGMDELFDQTKNVFVLGVTCVRVPVMVGHSESVNIEFHEPLDEDEARDILREAPGLVVIDSRTDDQGYITPKEAQGEFPVFVSRIRNDTTVKYGLNMWVVADNLRKGAALNAVQIAQLLHERGLIDTKQLA